MESKYCWFPPVACAIKQYGSVLFGLRSKLVCLSKPEDTSLLRNLLSYQKLRIHNVLLLMLLVAQWCNIRLIGSWVRIPALTTF